MRKQDPTTVQTVILSKERFETKEEANAWIKENDFIIKEEAPDETENSWRYRQREPEEFEEGSFRTIELTDGVKAVIGHLKERKEEKMNEAEARGAELLLPLNLEPAQIQELSFSVDKFKNAAASKSWAKNHGFELVSTPRQMKARIVARVASEDDFEDGTLQRVTLSKGVTALAGVRKGGEAAQPEPPQSAPRIPREPAVKRASVEVEFAKCGELLIRKAEDGEDPEASVRMFGIVMKPEVPDVEGDVTSEEEIENANFMFMKDFGTMGFMHKKDVSDRVKIIQDVVAPVDFEFPVPSGESKKIAKGTWYQELFTDDPELVKRVREGTLNGLSIGGRARREEITEMADGSIRLLPDLPFAEQQKRALEAIVAKRNEDVSKGEGDPALARFRDLRVEEVSLVDAAANEEDFFLIKRRKDMGKDKPNEAAAQKNTPPAAEDPPVQNSDGAPPAGDQQTDPQGTGEPTIAQQVAEGVKEGVKAAITEIRAEGTETKNAPAPTDPPADPVTKGFETLGARLDGIDKRLDEQDKALKDAATVKAAAKGQSVPDSTQKNEPEDPPADESKWAGTAVHSVFGKQKRTA